MSSCVSAVNRSVKSAVGVVDVDDGMDGDDDDVDGGGENDVVSNVDVGGNVEGVDSFVVMGDASVDVGGGVVGGSGIVGESTGVVDNMLVVHGGSESTEGVEFGAVGIAVRVVESNTFFVTSTASS